MALDREYFNSIELNPIKRKYYDVTAVDNLLVDIRRQAEIINHRAQDAKNDLTAVAEEAESYKQKCQALSEEVISLRKALSDAEEKAASMEFLLEKKEEKDIQMQDCEVQSKTIGRDKVEEMYTSMKKLYTTGLQTLEGQWKSFLASAAEEAVPSDLSSKISQIAMALQEINNELR